MRLEDLEHRVTDEALADEGVDFPYSHELAIFCGVHAPSEANGIPILLDDIPGILTLFCF